MTSLAKTTSSTQNPCAFQAAILNSFPNITVTAEGASVKDFIAALESVNVSKGICKIVGDKLREAAVASGKSGKFFDGADIRKTVFFDGLSTYAFRNGYNAQRFSELMTASPNSTFGAADVARMVRAVAAEQHADLKAIFFTLFEHSAIRQILAGSARVNKSELEGFFSRGVLTPHFMDPSTKKTLPRIAFHTAMAALAYGAQAAMNAITGGDNADVPKLSPLPSPVSAGASAALGTAKKCPFGHD